MTDQPTQPTNGGTIAYRMNRQEQDTKSQQDQLDKLEERVRILENEVAKLQERMTLFQAAQAMFTTIASAVAVFIGRS